MTGNRLVSLPFSDHCDPLVDDVGTLDALSGHAERYRADARWKYVELRPETSELSLPAPFNRADTYALHCLDLRPGVENLWRGFHRDSIQRRIEKAQRERLEYEEGRSDELLRKLYHLLGLTRRRHRVPLQPLSWFKNLIAAMGDALCIRTVSKSDEPVASVLTLTHGTTVVYKYGGSDARHNPLGGMPFLFWKVIENAKRHGLERLDMGRTDLDNNGLMVFKERFGARRSPLTYWRSPAPTPRGFGSRPLAMTRRLYDRLPSPVRRVTASVFYRHFG
jgi:hypothetical protein